LIHPTAKQGAVGNKNEICPRLVFDGYENHTPDTFSVGGNTFEAIGWVFTITYFGDRTLTVLGHMRTCLRRLK